MPIRAKPADAIPLTDAQKRTGGSFKQEFGSPAFPFAQKRLYLRPQHLNRIHIRAVRRQIPQLYACGVICVVCPRRSAAAFCHAVCSILPIFLISLLHIVLLFAAIVKGDCYFESCYNIAGAGIVDSSFELFILRHRNFVMPPLMVSQNKSPHT